MLVLVRVAMVLAMLVVAVQVAMGLAKLVTPAGDREC